MRVEDPCVGAKNVFVHVKLPKGSEDRIARMDSLGGDNAGGKSLANKRSGVIATKCFVPNSVEMGASGQEKVHVDYTGGRAGGVRFGAEGCEEGSIV